MYYVAYKPGDIPNSKIYLADDNDEPIRFEDISAAEKFLIANGITEESLAQVMYEKRDRKRILG